MAKIERESGPVSFLLDMQPRSKEQQSIEFEQNKVQRENSLSVRAFSFSLFLDPKTQGRLKWGNGHVVLMQFNKSNDPVRAAHWSAKLRVVRSSILILAAIFSLPFGLTSKLKQLLKKGK